MKHKLLQTSGVKYEFNSFMEEESKLPY